MRLRKHEIKDIPLMMEWMTDRELVPAFDAELTAKGIDDAKRFVKMRQEWIDARYYAIVSDEDDYMGTVSLRHIDMEGGTAEFAIIVRRFAMGKGYAMHGMIDVLDVAFNELGLSSVYWCVSPENSRAIRFFCKHGFNMLDEDIPSEIRKRYGEEKSMVWFAVLKGDDYRNASIFRGTVAGCRIICIKTIPTIEAGELSFFEANHDIPFEIKRIYYISKVPEGKRRGFHAHKELRQILFCPYGEIQMILDDGAVREEITLNDPSIGIIIEKPTWREMLWLKSDSVLCVAASDYYKLEDYIRDYNEFKRFLLEPTT